MPNRASESARAVFSDGLEHRLAPQGWELPEAPASRFSPLVRLTKPVDGQFTAVVELRGLVRGTGGSFPVDLRPLSAGIAYEPLRELWPVLGVSFAGALVSDDAAELLGTPRPAVQTIDRQDEAGPVIVELAALVPFAASKTARRFASIDALLTGVRLELLKKAALLAAIEQFEAAAEALARFVPIPGASPEAHISERHTIEQLEAWIQTRDSSKLAQAPVFEAPAIPPDPPLGQQILIGARYLWQRYRR